MWRRHANTGTAASLAWIDTRIPLDTGFQVDSTRWRLTDRKMPRDSMSYEACQARHSRLSRCNGGRRWMVNNCTRMEPACHGRILPLRRGWRLPPASDRIPVIEVELLRELPWRDGPDSAARGLPMHSPTGWPLLGSWFLTSELGGPGMHLTTRSLTVSNIRSRVASVFEGNRNMGELRANDDMRVWVGVCSSDRTASRKSR
ncbi:hypothetical protein LZ31DRAFT_315843 [Colletotrichum somersetense]|nr:hypothetical protein LZ31DRAFT_315843 [Colletotrichum somersetense]